MRRSRADAYKGFTLVEVLVISPIIILFIGAFIALAVGLTGESLQIREKNAAVYDVQAALNTMEASVVQTTGFMASTSGVQSPQGKNNSATQFVNSSSPDPDTLLLKLPATTRRPTDPARSLIYMGTGACNNKNPIYTYTTVYFVDPTTKSLYKRTILPQQPACDKPWQRGSCNANDIATNGSICKAQDEKLLDNVTAVNITYYADATSTTALDPTQASTATSVSISISVQKQTGGKTITYTSSLRSTSLNAQTSEVNTTPPATPAIAWSRSTTSPYTTTFTWDKVGSATGYNIRYRLGSTTWVNGPQNQDPNTTSYSVVGNARKQNEDIEVTVLTSAGNYLYGTMNTTLASWEECTPLNGWVNYDTTYNSLGFTKTTSGAVGLKGLIRAGPVGYNGAYVFCNLPAGFRPANHLIFNGVAYDPNGLGGNGSARIDIWPDGNMIVTGGSNTAYTNGFVSLDGIIFLAPDSGVSWQAGTWNSPWYYNSYSDTYPNLGYWRDSRGRTWVQGLATGGAGQSVAMASIPAGMGPTNGGMHININSANVGGVINAFGGTTNTLNSRTSNGNYDSTQLLFYSTGGLIPMNFYNSWHNYGSGWSTALCYQGSDDIVIVQGLIAGGTNQAAITNVGVCGASPYMSTGRRALFAAIVNPDVQGRIDMPTDNYLYAWASNSGWTSMDAIHYIAN